jgi:hypothetical protein
MEQPSQNMVHVIPSELPHFGTVCRARALHLSILACRIGRGPSHQTQNFYGRKKKEEGTLEVLSRQKVELFTQTIQKGVHHI